MSGGNPIVVVDYGMGNIHSILKALRRYSDRVVFTDDPSVIASAAAIVLPGDGAFAAAMENLSGAKLNAVLGAVAAGTPLLGVCIGFQILFEDSDEVFDGQPGELIQGMGLIPGHVRRFHSTDGLRIPHMGWNLLESGPASAPAIPDREYMYFIHSYRATGVPAEYVCAYTSYGKDRFPAAVRRGNILATQFHPEKSDVVGLRLLEDWVGSVNSSVASTGSAN